jgi:hypothetical protein
MYFVTVTNQFGSTNSAPATLTVNPSPQVSIATLRATVDSVNYNPTNTTKLYTVEGIVTTWVDTVSGNNASFFIQDGSAGIDVFWPGAPRTSTPNAGDRVKVTGPLTSFNGLLEIAPSFSNPLHSVEVISSNNPLPAPTPLPFNPTTVANPAIMDALEGTYVVASNVFLDLNSTVFASVSLGEQITNTSGETFTLFVNAQTDIVGRKKPVGPVTILGVLSQFDGSDPRTSGYEIIPTRFVDIIPAIRFTNVLQNLVRTGDRPTNTFEETVLRPGEKLTVNVSASDPGGGSITITPVLTGLPGTASWANSGAASGTLVTNQFVFQPSTADRGSNYVVALRVQTSLQTGTNTWSVYVPTVSEQSIFISEVFSSPTTNTNSPAFNPLHRAADTNNVAANDQFVEIANLGSADVDLFNWTLGSDVATRHKFFNGSFGFPPEVLGANNALVIYGGPLNNDANPPSLPVPTFPADVGSSPTLGLSANGGVVTLHNTAGNLIDRVVYSAADLAPTNSSLSRFPTINSALVAQAYVSTNFVTPGLQYDGGAWNLPTKMPTGVSSIVITPGNPLTLGFPANPAQASTLWQADSLSSGFRVTAGRQFSSGVGVFSITNPPPSQQFFFITTQ